MFPDSAFDTIAAAYDQDFTNSITGRLQRKRVWKFLQKELPAKRLDILEINCGTGEDAIWLAKQGHYIKGTDLSEQMISVARQKLDNVTRNPDCSFSVCAFEQLAGALHGQAFDLIFSNFGGLNCCNAAGLKKLDADFASLLRPGGKLIMVLMAKHCTWERWYFNIKGEKEKARRRQQPAMAKLDENALQPTWYYDTKELENIFSHFNLNTRKPVGLFLPPSYMEPWAKRRTFAMKLLNMAEQSLGNIPALADHADHIYLSFTKK